MSPLDQEYLEAMMQPTAQTSHPDLILDEAKLVLISDWIMYFSGIIRVDNRQGTVDLYDTVKPFERPSYLLDVWESAYESATDPDDENRKFSFPRGRSEIKIDVSRSLRRRLAAGLLRRSQRCTCRKHFCPQASRPKKSDRRQYRGKNTCQNPRQVELTFLSDEGGEIWEKTSI